MTPGLNVKGLMILTCKGVFLTCRMSKYQDKRWTQNIRHFITETDKKKGERDRVDLKRKLWTQSIYTMFIKESQILT